MANHVGAQQAGLDLVVVIDSSASMEMLEYGQADPLGLRYSAASLIVDLVGPNDRLGFVRFASNASILGEPQTLRLLSDPGAADSLKAAINETRSRPARTNDGTNYESALDKASSLFDPSSPNRRAVVFLTDGVPDHDVARVEDKLAPFVAQKTPVFLLLLFNKNRDASAGWEQKVDAVRTAFAATGPSPIDLSRPEQIGEAFARILTYLRPDLYVDSLAGAQATNNGNVFSATATSEYALSDVTFVVGTNQPTTSARLSENPGNAAALVNASGNYYALIRARSGNNQPLEGNWRLETSSGSSRTFAVLQSNVQFDLLDPSTPIEYVGGQRYTLVDQPTLVTVNAKNLLVRAGRQLVARLYQNSSCLERQENVAPFELIPRGLSEGNDLFWTKIPAQSQEAALEVGLAQLDQPFRLLRCYELTPLGSALGPSQFLEPQPGTAPVDRALPIKVQMPQGDVTWQSASVYLEPREGDVRQVALAIDAASALASGSITDFSGAAGDYQLRVVGRGVHNRSQAPVTMLVETVYALKPSLALPSEPVNAGAITVPGQPLTFPLRLPAPLVPNDAEIRLVAVEDVASSAALADPLWVSICPQARIVNNSAECVLEIRPPTTLAQGEYTIMLGVEAPQTISVNGSRVAVRFTVPAAQLALPDQPLDLGSMNAHDDLLTDTFTLTPTYIMSVPPITQTGTLLARELQRGVVNAASFNVALRQTQATPQELTVEVRADATLEPGQYELLLPLAAQSDPVPKFSPSNELRLRLSKPAPSLKIAWQNNTFDNKLSPIPTPADWSEVFGGSSRIEGAVEAFFTTAEDLPPPPVIRTVLLNDQPVMTDTLGLSWILLGKNSDNTYRYGLILRHSQRLAPGEYKLETKLPPIMGGQDTTFLFTVEGYLWAYSLVWMGLAIFLIIWVRGKGRSELSSQADDNANEYSPGAVASNDDW